MTINNKTKAPLGRVMLIDDESVDQMIYKRVIGRSGMADEVIGFTYAEDALEHLKDRSNPSIDLILLDINMPRMSGFEFLQAVAEQFGPDFQVPVVIMLTTSLNPRDKARAEAFEMVRAYVSKPLEVKDLEMARAKLEQQYLSRATATGIARG